MRWSGMLATRFPFGAPFVRAEFDFIGASGTELRLELVIGNFGIVHADVFLPDTEEINPIIESGQTCCGHVIPPSERFFWGVDLTPAVLAQTWLIRQ